MLIETLAGLKWKCSSSWRSKNVNNIGLILVICLWREWKCHNIDCDSQSLFIADTEPKYVIAFARGAPFQTRRDYYLQSRPELGIFQMIPQV